MIKGPVLKAFKLGGINFQFRERHKVIYDHAKAHTRRTLIVQDGKVLLRSSRAQTMTASCVVSRQSIRRGALV
jgi:hypothetical protein